jgi:hypothetical protein
MCSAFEVELDRSTGRRYGSGSVTPSALCGVLCWYGGCIAFEPICILCRCIIIAQLAALLSKISLILGGHWSLLRLNQNISSREYKDQSSNCKMQHR